LSDTDKPIAQLLTRFSADGAGVSELHATVDRLLELARSADAPVPEADAIAWRTALAEIAANILRHACSDVVGAMVTLSLTRFSDRVEATFEDPGKPFEAPPTRVVEDMPNGGMGLSVARASVDELAYTRLSDTNRWRLVRRLSRA
jgi:anti-sigma regulatory factor (Ser/Thr protein kinase)